ncbi:unnamed protein product [Toxocara canis]|uniref:Retrotransposon protein, putative, unclassified n=1 Tax=Toxocara canis TaxID=6265 RepID=A0A183UI18_TOXCA|nr:unnamed protein product [Toxocara canis]
MASATDQQTDTWLRCWENLPTSCRVSLVGWKRFPVNGEARSFWLEVAKEIHIAGHPEEEIGIQEGKAEANGNSLLSSLLVTGVGNKASSLTILHPGSKVKGDGKANSQVLAHRGVKAKEDGRANNPVPAHLGDKAKEDGRANNPVLAHLGNKAKEDGSSLLVRKGQVDRKAGSKISGVTHSQEEEVGSRVAVAIPGHNSNDHQAAGRAVGI